MDIMSGGEGDSQILNNSVLKHSISNLNSS